MKKLLTDKLESIENQEKKLWEDLKSTCEYENLTEIEVLVIGLKKLDAKRIVVESLYLNATSNKTEKNESYPNN